MLKKTKIVALAALPLVLGSAAFAGTAGTEFAAAVTQMTNWLEGSLGQMLALAFFAVGMFMGIARQSLMAAAVAVGCAFAVITAPAILNTIVSGSGASPEMAIELAAATPEALPILN